MEEERLEILEKINKMKNDVESIQTELDKTKQKKWYQTPSVIISISALCISCIFSIQGIITQKENKKKEIAEQISTSVNRLIELRKLFIKEGDIPGNINSERQGILSRIQENLSTVEKLLDANTIVQIGNEMMMDGRYVDAKQLFILGLRNSKSDMQKMIAYGYLSLIYFIPNPTTCKIDSFMHYKQKEFNIATSQSFDARNFYRGACYRETAYAYYYYKNDSKTGNIYLDSAKKEFRRFYDLHKQEPQTHIAFADSLYKHYNKNNTLN